MTAATMPTGISSGDRSVWDIISEKVISTAPVSAAAGSSSR